MSRVDTTLGGGRRPRGRPRKSDNSDSGSHDRFYHRDRESSKPSTSRDEPRNRHSVSDDETIFESPRSPAFSSPFIPGSLMSHTSVRLSRGSQKRSNKCDEVLDVIRKRLAEPSTFLTDKFTDIGKAWASKLRDLERQQAVHAEKIINDVFYEAQLGNLNRNCFLQILPENCTRNPQVPFNTQQSYNVQTPFNVQSPFNAPQSFSVQPSFHSRLQYTPSPTSTPSLTPSYTEPKEKPVTPKDENVAQLFEEFTDVDAET